jgi:hypothetical protein
MEAQKQIFSVIESELENAKESEADSLEKTLQEADNRISQIVCLPLSLFPLFLICSLSDND